MGEVYRARDSHLGREVAIKLLPAEFSKDPARVARFEREARLLASINHPAIAAIYGAEQSGDMRYLVLELVPGQTLKDRLEHPLAPKEALKICRQIAEGLEAAHEKGIVHRDLKPANVMVTPQGKVKVLDLGLAKAMDSSSSPADLSQAATAVLDETLPGVILGTIGYMSPEQARGKPIDKRTDIWAFGCILFECLAGRRAFSGGNVSDVIASILRSEPTWPDLPADTPPDVRELLRRCLEKDPNQRLRDIGDARIAIENNLASSAGVTRLWSAPAPKRSRARRGLAIAAGAAALAAAGWWIALKTLPSSGLRRTRTLAVLPFKDLSGMPGGQLLGDGLAETVSVRLAKLPGVQVVEPAAAVSAFDQDADPYRVAARLGAKLFLRGSVQRNGDRVRITYSLWNTDHVQISGDTLDGSDSDLFAIQDRLADRIGESLNLPRTPNSEEPSAGLETASAQGRYLQAIGWLQRYDKPASVDASVGLLEALAKENPQSALVHAALGKAYLRKYQQTRETKWVESAEKACRAAASLAPNLPDVHVTLGAVQLATGRADDAAREFRAALALQPNSSEATRGLAQADEALGRLGDAEKEYRRAIELEPLSWEGYNRLGVFDFNHGRYADAAGMFRRVTEITPDNVRGFYSLGAVYHEMGDLARAETAYKKSIALKPNSAALSNLGTLYYDRAQYRESADTFEKAVALAPSDSVLWTNLGDAYRWAPGLRARAGAAYRKAIDLARAELAINPKDAAACVTLALGFAKTGNAAEAKTQIERALAIDPRDVNTFYEAAIVASAGGDSAAAIDWIRRAAEAGYSRDRIEREPEFAGVRNHPDFQRALAAKSPPAR